MIAWHKSTTIRYESRSETYSKNHPDELFAVTQNLQLYLEEIELGKDPLKVKKGFIRIEPNGIRAISQSGGYKKKLAKTRLYTYCDTRTNTLYLLCIGGENGQGKDIEYCKKEVEKIRRTNG